MTTAPPARASLTASRAASMTSRGVRAGPMPTRPCARAMSGEIDIGIADALPDPFVLDRTLAEPRHALLMDLVIVE